MQRRVRNVNKFVEDSAFKAEFSYDKADELYERLTKLRVKYDADLKALNKKFAEDMERIMIEVMNK